MKEVRAIVIAMLILTFFTYGNLIAYYENIDAYNNMTNNHSWVSDLESNVEGVSFKGDKEQFFIGVSSSKGMGLIDKNGSVILPCKFFAAEYKNGDYMAAATKDKWILMTLDGKEVASFNRISYVYNYAGDKYFIKYGDDAYEDLSDGVSIVDAITGDIVKEYNDCYNAVRLDDGNWYISKTIDAEGIAARMVLTQMGLYSVDYSLEDETPVPYGFFTNENFEPLYGGKEYKLICQGNGIYVAKDMNVEDQDLYVVLDEDGELFRVTDEALSKRIKKYEVNGNLGNNDTVTVFKNMEGSIGFASIDNIYDVLYYSDGGNYIGDSKLYKNNYAVDNEDWIVFTETEKDEYFTTTKYGLKDKKDNVILPAVNYDLRFLQGTENIMVNSSMGCGIIRLEVN